MSLSCSSNSYSEIPIVMGCSARAGWYPWEVAYETKIFQKHNLNLKFTWFDNYTESVNAMLEGKLDVNCQTLDETISAVAKGLSQVIVLTTNSSRGNDKIVCSEAIKNIVDLKGKTVAVEPGTAAHFLLLLGLKDVGLSQKDINLRPMLTTGAAEAFYKGDVDAVGAFAPFTTRALERAGSKELFSSELYPEAITAHLVVSRKLIDKGPQIVQAIINSWYETMNYIQAKPEETYQMMAKRAGVTVEEYRAYDVGNKVFGIEESVKAFEPANNTKSLPYVARQISKFLLENGLIKKAPDLNNLFESRFTVLRATSNHSGFFRLFYN